MAKVARFREALGLGAEDLAWQDLASCRDKDSSLWFPRVGESKRRVAMAQAICEECPVQEECLEYALNTRQQHGIWGGLQIKERRRVLRNRR